MKILTKIKHILPYLYYRTFQFYEKHENEGDSDISAHLWLSAIELLYLITFVVYPLDVMVFDRGLGQMLSEATEKYTRLGLVVMASPIGYLIYRLEKPRMNRYYEMMPMWKNETESQRRKKWWILLFVCIFPFASFYPLLCFLKSYFPAQNKETRIEYKQESFETVKPIDLEGIDESDLWQINQE